MFIQVIRGRVKDAAALKAASERWDSEIKPGAIGFLGATEGVTDDGQFVAVARFESEESAQANSSRPEQDKWWTETSKLFDGDVQFFDCPRVETFMGGGSDDAGFVQVMVYKPSDVDTLMELSKEFMEMPMERKDILGGTTAIAKDGTVIDTNYFTSEKEAREGEKQGFPEDMQATMQRFGEIAGEIEYIDLREPWLYSA